MPAARFYSNAPATTIPAGCTNSATSITVGSITGFPVSYPYTLILDPDTALEEVVTVTGGTGVNLTVTRGADSTAGLAHGAGAVAIHGVSAREFTELQAHIAATTGVHGLSGVVVGTTDTQTLSGKTLTSPTINNATMAAPIISGPLIGATQWSLASHTHAGVSTAGNIPASSVTGTAATLAGTETLANKTLTTPTIGSMVNATHDHSAGAGGGNIPQASVTGLAAKITAYDAATLDSGWTSISLAAGILALGSATPQYKKVGNQVFLRGQIERTASADFAVGSTTTTGTALPAGFRPLVNISRPIGCGSSGSITARINITTAGVVTVTNLAAAGVNFMDLGVAFWVD